MSFERIRLTFEGGVAVLTLAHPESLNAMSPKMLEEMQVALDRIAAPERGVRALILTGEGRAFCSGVNLQDESVAVGAVGEFDAGALLDQYFHPLLHRFRDLNLPLITAINGACVGIGMSFALMGDLILAARSAYFLHAFRRIGLVPDGGSSWLLPRLVGLARAKELSFLGEKLAAEKALDWGLINRVHADERLMPMAMAMAQELAGGATVAFGHMHQLYWASPDASYDQQLEREREAQRECGRTRDFYEAVTAFAAKRPPKFEGR